MDLKEVKDKNEYYGKIIKEVKMEKEIMNVEIIQPVLKIGADAVLFRASGCGHLMVEPKEKSPFAKWASACENLKEKNEAFSQIENKTTKSALNKKATIEKLSAELQELTKNKNDIHLSESTKIHLIDLFISAKYKRREEINNKFLTKGDLGEEDSVTLLSRVTKRLFKKNVIRMANEYVTGEWDLQIDSNGVLIETIDTKTSWSAHTFFRAQSEIKPMYYWQGVVYMWLTGALKHTVAYCLVNGLASAIMDEKRKLSFKTGMMDQHGNETEKFISQCKQIEINHIFDLELFRSHNPYFEFHNDLSEWAYDIPMSERVFTITFDRNDDDIERLKKRIIDCRAHMNKHLFKL